jgi:hypothetical protein
MRKCLKTCLISFAALTMLSGCVVYEPRPHGYYYSDYAVYDGPSVVYVHGYYGGYYHRGYYR